MPSNYESGGVGSVVPLFGRNFATQWLVEAFESTRWYQERQIKRDEHLTRTPPKVSMRKRALSVSEMPANSRMDNIVKQQQQSRFCLLPTELRLQIYEEIIKVRGGIHIMFLEGILHAYHCQWSSDLAISTRHAQCWYHDYNESRWTELKFGKDSSRLDILALLQSCKLIYNESIGYLYSQPKFMFHDYLSFVAFVGAMLPQRFNSIQSIYIYRPLSINDSRLSNHSRPSIFECPADYRALHDYNFVIRNPILARLPSSRATDPGTDRWSQVRKILRKMSALREVKVLGHARTFTREEEDLREQGLPTDGERRMREAMDNLWHPRVIDGWKDFHFSTHVFPNGANWHGVKHLKKKKKLEK